MITTKSYIEIRNIICIEKKSKRVQVNSTLILNLQVNDLENRNGLSTIDT